MINSTKASWRPVSSRVPQESVLGPVLFNIFIYDLDDGTKHTLSKFAGDTKLRGVADTSEDHAATQRDLEKGPSTGWRNGPTGSHEVHRREILHLGRNNPRHQDRLEANWLESNFADKDLGVLVNSKFKNVTWPQRRPMASCTALQRKLPADGER